MGPDPYEPGLSERMRSGRNGEGSGGMMAVDQSNLNVTHDLTRHRPPGVEPDTAKGASTMHAAIQTTGSIFAYPVLVLGPGFHGTSTAAGLPVQGITCQFCGDSNVVSFADVRFSTSRRDAEFDLLETADATWEDAEWR